MKRCLTLALCLLLFLSCTACGGAPAPQAMPEEDRGYNHVAGDVYAPSGTGMGEDRGVYEMAGEMEAAAPAYGEGSGGSVYDRADAKLIRRATLTVETLAFEEAAATLDAMVQSYDGYYERSDIWGGAYEGATRSGYYLVRIPRQAYDSFMNAVGDVGQMTRRTETTEDVGEDYANAEIRLGTLYVKHERLLALLEKATDMESIVALQGYLSDVEYEIDYLSGTLRRYDGLVDYASIEISLEERVRLSGDPGEKASFATQFGAALSNGLSGFGQAVKHLLLWAAYHFVGLLFFAAAVIFLVVFARKRLRGRRRTFGSPLFKAHGAPPHWEAQETQNPRDVQDTED